MSFVEAWQTDASAVRHVEYQIRTAPLRLNVIAAQLTFVEFCGVTAVFTGTARRAHDAAEVRAELFCNGDQFVYCCINDRSELVDDLLGVSRIVQNKIEFRHEPITLFLIIGRSANAVGVAIENRNQQFSVSMPR